jgi:apolipoprotein N-acyltransferase
MRISRPVRFLLAIASGAAIALSFPNYNLSFLAWLGIAMLMLASLGVRPREAALYGFLHGLVFYPTCLPWIATVIHQFGNVDPVTAAAVLGLMGVAGGLIDSIFSSSVAAVGKRSVPLACLLAPFLWVTLEFLRAHLPIISFPWNLLGYAVSGNLALLQLTAWTGIYGLSFLAAAFSALLVWSLLERTRRSFITVFSVAAILLLLSWQGARLLPQAIPHYWAHLVQTNFPQSEHYPPDWMQIHAPEMDQLEKISVDAARRQPGLIVWPETPAPFSLRDPVFAARAERIASDSGNDFLVGVVTWTQASSGEWQASNSAVLLDPSGHRLFSYDKIHLVPFGEYVPLRPWIKFAGRLTADIADFTPGTTYSIGRLDGGQFGVFICYEAIFGDEIRRFSLAGADLLITISNDGWFGRSAAPAQHLMMARVRAVESRRWLLRDTNNGYTVSVDPYGRYVASMATDIRGELDAPYDFRSDRTLYVRWSDWFAWLCVAASLGLIVFGISRRAGRASSH